MKKTTIPFIFKDVHIMRTEHLIFIENTENKYAYEVYMAAEIREDGFITTENVLVDRLNLLDLLDPSKYHLVFNGEVTITDIYSINVELYKDEIIAHINRIIQDVDMIRRKRRERKVEQSQEAEGVIDENYTIMKTSHLIMLLNLKKELHTYEVFYVLDENNQCVEVDKLNVKELLNTDKYRLIRNGELFVGWKCQLYYIIGVTHYEREIASHMDAIIRKNLLG